MIESALAGKEFDMESAVSQPIKMGVGAAGGIYKVAGRKERGLWLGVLSRTPRERRQLEMFSKCSLVLI